MSEQTAGKLTVAMLVVMGVGSINTAFNGGFWSPFLNGLVLIAIALFGAFQED